MKLHRMYAIVLQNFYIFRHSADRVIEVFYWPLVNLLLWGLTGQYFAKETKQPGIVLFILSGLVFWTVVSRGQQEITIALLEELWSRNLANIFVPPLMFSEWIIAILFVSLTKTAISFGFVIILIFVLYKLDIFYFGLYLLPFLLLLLMTAWAVGFFVAGLILRYGVRIQVLGWSLIAVLAPLSGVYYSLSILPAWAQRVASYIPISYVFEGAHAILEKGRVDITMLSISFLLNSVYLILGIIYLRRSFIKVLEQGLIKV